MNSIFILLGIISVIISMLLWTYYSMKANEDDLNRPSFFNSKFRKYFLLCMIIILFITGNLLLIVSENYNLVWLLPLLFYISYLFIRLDWRQKVIIKKVFQYYKAFANPDLSMMQDDQLMSPVLFMTTMAHLPKEFQDKAKKYLKDRIDNGKIKSVKDLPNEAWIVLESVGKKEISGKDIDKIPQRKIDYLYEETFEEIQHRDLSKILVDWLWRLEANFERLFKNYAFVCLPRPDFTEQDIQLVNPENIKKGKKYISKKQYPVFPDAWYYMAYKFGWVRDMDEYFVLAALEFQRRFPEHKFSKKIKKMHKYSDQQIFDYAQNWERLDIRNIDLTKI